MNAVDTNVFVYAFDADEKPSEEPRAERGTVPFCSSDSAKGDSPRRFAQECQARRGDLHDRAIEQH